MVWESVAVKCTPPDRASEGGFFGLAEILGARRSPRQATAGGVARVSGIISPGPAYGPRSRGAHPRRAMTRVERPVASDRGVGSLPASETVPRRRGKIRGRSLFSHR